MGAEIASYHPDVEIKINTIDISKALGDVGTVLINKALYAPAAEFHINLPDMPFGDKRESLYGLINPVDPIEIRMRRLPHSEWFPVLRGFVRSVGRHEQISGDGRPQRMVVIAGNDCGAVFLMEQLRALITWHVSGETGIPPPYVYLTETGLTGSPEPANEFIWQAAVNPTKKIMDAAGFEFQRAFSVHKGHALVQYALAGEGPVWEFIRRYSDAPWNELFVREGETQPELVFRHTPWRTIDNAPLPDADLKKDNVQFYDVPIGDVVSLTAHRDDSELVQWAHVLHPAVETGGNSLPLEYKIFRLNYGTADKFGDRLQEITSYLLPGAFDSSLPEKQQLASQNSYKEWLEDRVQWIAFAGEDIHRFERGVVTIKGNPKIQVGNYIRVRRGAIVWEGYITSVTNDYQPFRRYLTTIEYIRGTQFVQRSRIPNPWDAERMKAAP